ncbi:MAG: hypothetical protein ACYDBP_07150 [Leptospirales bacterium]
MGKVFTVVAGIVTVGVVASYFVPDHKKVKVATDTVASNCSDMTTMSVPSDKCLRHAFPGLYSQAQSNSDYKNITLPSNPETRQKIWAKVVKSPLTPGAMKPCQSQHPGYDIPGAETSATCIDTNVGTTPVILTISGWPPPQIQEAINKGLNGTAFDPQKQYPNTTPVLVFADVSVIDRSTPKPRLLVSLKAVTGKGVRVESFKTQSDNGHFLTQEAEELIKKKVREFAIESGKKLIE